MSSNFDQSPFNKARKDKFTLVLTLPDALKDIDNSGVRSNDLINKNALQFSLYGSVIPEISIPEITAPYSGQSLKLTSHARPTYPNMKVPFTIDNRFNNYWVIYTWLNLLNDARHSDYDHKNITGTLKNNDPLAIIPKYSVIFSIFGLDEFDKPVIEFKFIGGFPVKLAGIDYNNRDTDEITSEFELAYSQMLVTLIER